MDDKQIIIHNVDVSKCKKYEHEIIRCNTTLKNMCSYGGRCTDKNNVDCNYKNWQRAEQKLAKIKKVCNKFIPDHYKILLIINGGIVEE